MFSSLQPNIFKINQYIDKKEIKGHYSLQHRFTILGEGWDVVVFPHIIQKLLN